MSALSKLQTKSGITADGVWGPNTYRAAKKYFKLTDNQAAHFFGQCSHESGGFKIFTENLNYSAEGLQKTFAKYFPTLESTTGYARNPEKIANKVYGNRMGNGPETSGDGWKFRGRGAVQLTGKNNYTSFSTDIKRQEVLSNPEIVADELAFDAAIWFFQKNKIFDIANKGISNEIITQITKIVNGGTHGLDDRILKTKQYAAWN